MRVFEGISLPAFKGDLRCQQGVFYFTPDGYNNFVECADAEELLNAVRRYPVHTIRVITFDERILEFELAGYEVYFALFQQETYSGIDWLSLEGDYDESEGSND